MTLAAVLTLSALLASPPVLLQEQTQPSSTQPQAQPETSKPEPPSQTPAPPPAQPQTSPQPEPAVPETTKPSPTKKHHHKKKKPTTSDDAPKKIVVRNGSTTEPTTQIAPGGLSKQQANTQAQTTTQLINTTSANLQRLSSRQLSPSQQDTIKQILTYVDQAKSATDAGDLQRAYNLAFKAHLLSDDLLKH
jgi:outer membrane biosynthesis protein TonB